MASFIAGIVQLSLGVIFLASVFIYTVKNTNTSGWTTTETTLYNYVFTGTNSVRGFTDNCGHFDNDVKSVIMPDRHGPRSIKSIWSFVNRDNTELCRVGA